MYNYTHINNQLQKISNEIHRFLATNTTSTEQQVDYKTMIGAIAGIGIGLVLIFLLIYCIYKKYCQKKPQKPVINRDYDAVKSGRPIEGVVNDNSNTNIGKAEDAKHNENQLSNPTPRSDHSDRKLESKVKIKTDDVQSGKKSEFNSANGLMIKKSIKKQSIVNDRKFNSSEEFDSNVSDGNKSNFKMKSIMGKKLESLKTTKELSYLKKKNTETPEKPNVTFRNTLNSSEDYEKDDVIKDLKNDNNSNANHGISSNHTPDKFGLESSSKKKNLRESNTLKSNTNNLHIKKSDILSNENKTNEKYLNT